MSTSQEALPGMEAITTREDDLQAIVKRAILDPAFDADKLKVLLEVKLKWDSEESRRQFEEAFQLFKRNLPDIFRTKRVSFPTSQGGKTEYSHAELDKIAPILSEALLDYGITQSWESGEENGRIAVTCVFEGFGHIRKAAKLVGPPDSSGGKNTVQAIGSTTTYLQRYTLCMACGVVPKGLDDDGRKGECMAAQAIEEYCIAMRDTTNFEELKPVWADCYTKAKKLNDLDAIGQLRKVYEAQKKSFLEHKQ